MQELVETGIAAWELILYSGVSAATIYAIGLGVSAINKATKNANEELDVLLHKNSDNLGRDDLVQMYSSAMSIRSALPRRRDDEFAYLVDGLKEQLEPIIKDEVRDSLNTTQIKPGTSLEELSQTHRETYGRHRE